MILRTPIYYKDFTCIGSDCNRSCCKGWALEIDEATYEYYQSLEGEFGERIRHALSQADFIADENSPIFSLEVDGSCPFLEEDGLCSIVKNLGEESLCEICATYPRASFSYGDTTEVFLTLSCEAACSLHFSQEYSPEFTQEEYPSPDIEDLGLDSYKTYPAFRDRIHGIIHDTSKSIQDRLLALQDFIRDNQEGASPIMDSKALTDRRERIHILQGMNPIDDDWIYILADLIKSINEKEFDISFEAYKSLSERTPLFSFYEERILSYYVFRYLPSGVYTGDYRAHILFAIFVLYSLRDFFALYLGERGSLDDEDLQEIIITFSRQLEHSEENMEFCMEELLFS